MSRQLDIVLALKALSALALPGAELVGFDKDTTKPLRIGPDGAVIGHPGTPGDPDIDLSPPAYNYVHRFYLEVAGPNGAGGAALDAMLIALGVGIAVDRTLGGLCDHIEAVAPERNDRTLQAAPTVNWAMVAIDATYTVSDPLA
jgi:hypothetical protein